MVSAPFAMQLSAGFSAGHVALLFICLPHLSVVVSALFRFLFICLPGLSLLVSALFCWPCKPCTAGVPLAMLHFYSFVSQVSHSCCPPFSAGDATFLFVGLPGLSLAAPALSTVSIHLSPMSVTAGVSPFRLAMQHFYSFVTQACHWWCPPLSVGHAAFLFICLPGLSLVVSALFRRPRSVTGRWPCSISIHVSPGLSLLMSALFGKQCSIPIHLSPRSVTACVRPSAMQHFYSLVSRSVIVGARPFPLAMQHFYSFVFQVCHCWRPPFSAGHAAFLFICLPCDFFFPKALRRVLPENPLNTDTSTLTLTH